MKSPLAIATSTPVATATNTAIQICDFIVNTTINAKFDTMNINDNLTAITAVLLLLFPLLVPFVFLYHVTKTFIGAAVTTAPISTFATRTVNTAKTTNVTAAGVSAASSRTSFANNSTNEISSCTSTTEFN